MASSVTRSMYDSCYAVATEYLFFIFQDVSYTIRFDSLVEVFRSTNGRISPVNQSGVERMRSYGHTESRLKKSISAHMIAVIMGVYNQVQVARRDSLAQETHCLVSVAAKARVD